jgi:hypothetical protein
MRILELLSLRKGTTLTKEMFLNHLYGGIDEPELKIIDVFVCKLRKKLSTACRRRQLHRNGVGSRLCAERPGSTARSRARKSRRSGVRLLLISKKKPRQQCRGFFAPFPTKLS